MAAPAPYKLNVPPPSMGGVECDGTGKNCVTWVLVDVPKFIHVTGQDPPCATDPNAIAASVEKKLADNAAALIINGAAAGSYLGPAGSAAAIAGALMGAVIGGMVASAFSSDSQVFQAFHPPPNFSRCQIVAVVLPADAEVLGTTYWADSVAKKDFFGVAEGVPELEQRELLMVSPGVDISWAKFDSETRTRLFTPTGSPSVRMHMIWTVFKNWAGGLDRRAGLKVAFRIP